MEVLKGLLLLVVLLVSVERSDCVRCFAKFYLDSGECDEELGEVDEDDCCQNPQYGYQATDGECRSCGPPVWSPWSPWSPCNVLRGDGVRQKRRQCFGLGDCENADDKLQTEPCNGTCFDDEGWALWSPWSTCSVTCGGVGVRKRERVCASHPDCRIACSGPSEETEGCTSLNACPVHGGWSPWSSWSDCSGSCIDATTPTRERWRSCSDPAPSSDTEPHGKSCPGDDSQTQSCSEIPNCPVDGNWGAWSPPGPCSVTCGEGLRLSNRKCDSPTPKYGGRNCDGPSSQSSVCQSPCPVDGFWSGWSSWSECSASCLSPNKASVRSRQRSCSNPEPSSTPRGAPCRGELSQSEQCHWLPHCPVDGGWGPWSPFSPCAVTCGVGAQVSVRKCDSPIPKYGGRPCPGEGRQTTICHTNTHCPVDGLWSEWSPWSDCISGYDGKTITCKKLGGKQIRERECLHRAHNGTLCAGFRLLDRRVCYDVKGCYIKGSWGGWESWSLCKPPCGAGSRRTRTRLCNPDYSGYSRTIGRQREEATFFGRPLLDCGPLPVGEKKAQAEPCVNVPPCT
ncbi:properdin-like [Mugil cephalus]|uniref:properdin-like n=1 Tax=Mugil cephalus TaxID=48193 RepID=UPI001FB5C909|nr:properdin-like [Mugil cephalus]